MTSNSSRPSERLAILDFTAGDAGSSVADDVAASGRALGGSVLIGSGYVNSLLNHGPGPRPFLAGRFCLGTRIHRRRWKVRFLKKLGYGVMAKAASHGLWWWRESICIARWYCL